MIILLFVEKFSEKKYFGLTLNFYSCNFHFSLKASRKPNFYITAFKTSPNIKSLIYMNIYYSNFYRLLSRSIWWKVLTEFYTKQININTRQSDRRISNSVSVFHKLIDTPFRMGFFAGNVGVSGFEEYIHLWKLNKIVDLLNKFSLKTFIYFVHSFEYVSSLLIQYQFQYYHIIIERLSSPMLEMIYVYMLTIVHLTKFIYL